MQRLFIFVLLLTLCFATSKAQIRATDSPNPSDTIAPHKAPTEKMMNDREQADFLAKHSQPVLLFAEKRTNIMQRQNKLPHKWLTQTPQTEYTDTLAINEYYTFQVVLMPVNQSVDGVQITFADLKGDNGQTISHERLVCLSTQCLSEQTTLTTRPVSIPQGQVAPLWIGVDVPPNAVPGNYSGQITVSGNNMTDRVIALKFYISTAELIDRGDSNPANYSRLRWLVNPFTFEGDATFDVLPKRDKKGIRTRLCAVDLQTNGMPLSITNQGYSILQSAIEATYISPKNEIKIAATKVVYNSQRTKTVAWTADCKATDFEVQTEGEIDKNARIDFTFTPITKGESDKTYLRITIPLRGRLATLFTCGTTNRQLADTDSIGGTLTAENATLWLGSVSAGLLLDATAAISHTETPIQYTIQKHDTVARLQIDFPLNLPFIKFSLLPTPVNGLYAPDNFTRRYAQVDALAANALSNNYSDCFFVSLYNTNWYNKESFAPNNDLLQFVERMFREQKKVLIDWTPLQATTADNTQLPLVELGYTTATNNNLIYSYLNYKLATLNEYLDLCRIDGITIKGKGIPPAYFDRLCKVTQAHKTDFMIDYLWDSHQSPAAQGLYAPYIHTFWLDSATFDHNSHTQNLLTATWPWGSIGNAQSIAGSAYSAFCNGIMGHRALTVGSFEYRNLWKLVDEYQLSEAKLFVGNASNSPVLVLNETLQYMAFANKGRVVMVISSVGSEAEQLSLLVPGIKAQRIYAPAIDGLQSLQEYSINSLPTVLPGGGIILVVEE